MASLSQDAHFSFRLIRKRPGTSSLVIVSVALGIGLNVAIFSVVNAVLLRPLPILKPDRVVWLRSKVNQTGAPLGTSYPDYLDWKSQSQSFESIAALRALTFTMTGYGPPENLKATAISASGFKTWGINVAVGRDFADGDDQSGANRVAILNHSFWQRKFGGDSGILGKTLALDNRPYTVIGVLPPIPLNVLRYPDIYVANAPLIDSHILERDTRYFFPVGRLKPDVSLGQATAEMQTIAARLAAQYPQTNKDMGIRLDGFSDQLTADGRKPLPFLMIASSLILLLAIVNVMTVFLAFTADRSSELTTRLALGASRTALIRQLLIHSLIFGLSGGALGLLLAKLGLALFLQIFPDALSRFQETTIDFHVVLVNIGLALLTSLLAILPAALYAQKLSASSRIVSEWNAATPPKSRALGRAALILLEISLASALSLVSGLLIKSFYEVARIDLGFNPRHVFSFQVNLPITKYKERASQSAFYKTVVQKLANLPGLESTSAISGLPLTNEGNVNQLELDGESPLFGQQLLVEDEGILPGFFRTMQIPILKGRDFTDADHEGTPSVAIVDDVLATKLWPGKNPLGKRIRMTGLRDNSPHWIEVIGVVQEIKHFGNPEAKIRWMQIYVPQYQDPTPTLSFVSSTPLPQNAAQAAAEKSIHDLDKHLPVENFQMMDELLDNAVSGRRAGLILVSSFAAIGIALAMVGIFGVISNYVTRRRREMAIRMALGATRQKAVMIAIRTVLAAAALGVLTGSGIVIGSAGVLSSFLFGITALHAPIYLASTVIILCLAILASLAASIGLFRLNIQEALRE